MKAGLLGRRRVHVALAQAIKKCMRGLVCHNLMRETREDRLAAVKTRKVAEEEALRLVGVEGVRIGEGMWRDLDLVTAEAPLCPSPQSQFETSECLHDDGVGQPGMKVEALQQLS